MRLRKKISICFSGFLLLIGAVRVGATPTAATPGPPTWVAQECPHSSAQGAVQQAHVYTAEGDALFAHVQKLLNEGRALQDPVLQALASKIHAAYEQAMAHLSAAQVEEVLLSLDAPAESTKPAGELSNKMATLDTLLRNLARAQRDAWKVTHRWPVAGSMELAIQIRHVEDTLQSEWGVVKNERNAGEAAKEEMNRLLRQGTSYGNTLVRAQAAKMYASFARVRTTLWHIRIETDVWMSSYVEGTVPATLRDQYERALAYTDHANFMQALAQWVLVEAGKSEHRDRSNRTVNKRAVQRGDWAPISQHLPSEPAVLAAATQPAPRE